MLRREPTICKQELPTHRYKLPTYQQRLSSYREKFTTGEQKWSTYGQKLLSTYHEKLSIPIGRNSLLISRIFLPMEGNYFRGTVLIFCHGTRRIPARSWTCSTVDTGHRNQDAWHRVEEPLGVIKFICREQISFETAHKSVIIFYLCVETLYSSIGTSSNILK